MAAAKYFCRIGHCASCRWFDPTRSGATMLLRLDQQQQIQQSDTIGGGHLEFQAIDIAKQMLLSSESCHQRIERFNLSARLGQCCGGVMWLLFEKIEAIKDELIACQIAWQKVKVSSGQCRMVRHPLGRLQMIHRLHLTVNFSKMIPSGNGFKVFNPML